MLGALREMPVGVRIFLCYGFLMLALIGLTLPGIVAQAVEAPITGIGLLWMLLLAYLIFTLTLVLQRKQAGYGFALGLASLTVPAIPVLGLFAGIPGAALAIASAVMLFLALRPAATRAWFREP